MPLSSKPNKQSLENDLRQLLLAGDLTSQETLGTALTTQGHNVNQSKVSRLLRKLGAIKSKNEHGDIVYRLPHEPAPPTLENNIQSLIIEVLANETTLIVNTSPGSAQLVARIIDYHKKELEIIATIAGDDTVLIIPKSIKKIEYSLNTIKRLLLEN